MPLSSLTARRSRWLGDSLVAVDRPDWTGLPPLVEACCGNNNAPDDPERVRKLLKRGANINITDHKGKTPRHRASQAGHVKITRLLLENGADLEPTDPIRPAALRFSTPLTTVARRLRRFFSTLERTCRILMIEVRRRYSPRHEAAGTKRLRR